ncbi:MAG: peptidoglycan DD-metalloendopeptidase family protein [Paracoccaceae bacterium]
MAAIWGGVFAVVAAVVAGLWFGGVLTIVPPGGSEVTVENEEGVVDQGGSYVTPFVDLAGDPMLLRFDTGSGAEKTRKLLRPIDLAAGRVGNELLLLTDAMITKEERLITTLPSSREDFAFFQAQREAPKVPPRPVTEAPEPAVSSQEVVLDEEGSSWGDSLDGSAPTADTFTQTKEQNTTSLNFILPEAQRQRPYEDVFLRLKDKADFAALMVENGIDEAAAKRFAEAALALVPETGALGAGHIIAVRGAARGGVRVPVQMSLYTHDTYFGSLAVSDAGDVVTSADPWVEEDLFSFAGEDAVAGADLSRKYRLLDAFYSAAIRNGVPSAVVAETIVMLSQAHDLEAFAAPGDEMTLLYAREPGSDGPGPGQVLYAAIKGEGKALECHVFKVKEEYSCFTAGRGGASGVGLRAGLQTPVQGVLTSRFGPRMHPILKVAKLHKGVDWAAPTGTPVVAAFDGTVLAAGDGKGYGNVVRISHEGGRETRYAHLNAFADGISAGISVTAGTLIGYVGTTGQSTGPHLHFELYEGGEAVDPLGVGGGSQVAASDGSAVEKLVDQIIRVESGGNASAKNPLSSATGLGQFIESTWVRMMKQYRPDLASTMDRAALLQLRFDPTISREMVTVLAREGEAYLRARGHEITAGRLYLCHFLGAEGANMVLSSQDDQLIVDVMGAGVVNANPFLAGRTVAYIKEWAELKMNKKGGGAPLPAAVVIPPEVVAYQKMIAGLIGSPT